MKRLRKRVFRRRSTAPELSSPDTAASSDSMTIGRTKRTTDASSCSMASTVPEYDDDNDDYDEDQAVIVYGDGSTTRTNRQTRAVRTNASPGDDDDSWSSRAVQRQQQQKSRRGGADRNVLHALGQWCSAVQQLCQSHELRLVLVRSGQVVGTASNAALYTALLPITLPCHVMQQTTGLVARIVQLLWQATSVAVLCQKQPVGLLLGLDDSSSSTDNDNRDDDDKKNKARMSRRSLHQQQQPQQLPSNHGGPLDLVLGVFGFPGHVLGVATSIAGMVTDGIGSVVTQLVAPNLNHDNSNSSSSRHGSNHKENVRCKSNSPKKYTSSYSTCTSTTSDDDFLDRLRLDFGTDPAIKDTAPQQTTTFVKPKVVVASAPASRMLLRVDDLDITCPETCKAGQRLYCIDLTGKDPSCSTVFANALDRLAQQGLELFANHPSVRLSRPMEHHCSIAWKTEGSTAKLLRKLAKLSTLERLEALKTETLIWSGKMGELDQNNHHTSSSSSSSLTSSPPQSSSRHLQVPLFLSRGIIQMSPRDFLHLLWDNNRTAEYNNYCLGRHDIVMLNDAANANHDQADQVLHHGASTGTKVIESETRVPFTGLSIRMSCLMHVRPLEPPDQGYVIVSRSLHAGAAGNQSVVRRMEDSSNNIKQTLSSPSNNNNNSRSEILWGVNVIRHVPHHAHLTDLTSLSQVSSTMVPKWMTTRIGIMGIEDFYKMVRQNKKCVVSVGSGGG